MMSMVPFSSSSRLSKYPIMVIGSSPASTKSPSESTGSLECEGDGSPSSSTSSMVTVGHFFALDPRF